MSINSTEDQDEVDCERERKRARFGERSCEAKRREQAQGPSSTERVDRFHDLESLAA